MNGYHIKIKQLGSDAAPKRQNLSDCNIAVYLQYISVRIKSVEIKADTFVLRQFATIAVRKSDRNIFKRNVRTHRNLEHVVLISVRSIAKTGDIGRITLCPDKGQLRFHPDLTGT